MNGGDRSADIAGRLVDQVRQAIAGGTPLRIRGGNSKAMLGRPVEAAELDIRDHRGIVKYDPSELVVTVRAGTPLAELNVVLDAQGQMLPCEPPEYAGNATIGGAVASGLAGPRRPWSGSVRDFVLGCRLVTGQAKHLRFGGEVMKNVAGFDVSRLMAGSFGCLGVLTELSLKVLPKARELRCLYFDMEAGEALAALSRWRRAALPLTGALYMAGRLHVRIEGGAGSVLAACGQMGGDEEAPQIWNDLREQRLPFFEDGRPLWRLSVPVNAPVVELPGESLLDWGGAQRWLKSDAHAQEIRALAGSVGGHATCFTPGPGIEPFHPLPEAMLRIQKRLKASMDPHGIFNPGRMYPDI